VVIIRIGWTDTTLTMHVGDNGSGFDPSSPETGRGRGLLNFQARARILGGTCRIESAPGAGTNVILEIPLPRL
jgi:signal transduction histidine kinase